VNWQTGTPKTPGVYRVAEPRASVWYCLWTGQHWCVGADSIEEAACETLMRSPPTAWGRQRQWARDARNSAHRQAASLDAPERSQKRVKACPEAVARLRAWGA
jgi:hypothetical protein